MARLRSQTETQTLGAVGLVGVGLTTRTPYGRVEVRGRTVQICLTPANTDTQRAPYLNTPKPNLPTVSFEF